MDSKVEGDLYRERPTEHGRKATFPELFPSRAARGIAGQERSRAAREAAAFFADKRSEGRGSRDGGSERSRLR